VPLLALRDYGLAGNEYSTALISRFGSVDWLALPFLDSKTHFSAYFNERTGGRFQILPEGEFKSELQTHDIFPITPILFETPHGKGLLTHWMPAGQPALLRKIEVLEGAITWIIHCSPRFDSNSRPPQCERFASGILFRGARSDQIGYLESDRELEISADGHSARMQFKIPAGGSALFRWALGRDGLPKAGDKIQNATNSLEQALQYWKSDQHRCPPQGCPFAGPWHHQVLRSASLLRLIQNPWGGLLAESVVPVLPDFHTGDPNHRVIQTWTRDLWLGFQALINLGMKKQAESFFLRMTDLLFRDTPQGFQPSYTLDGGHSSMHHGESESMFRRFHFDVQGQFLITAAEFYRSFGHLPARLWPVLCELTDTICHTWRKPDWGIWDANEPRSDHFVTSKVIAWAGIHRACWLARQLQEELPKRWLNEAQILHRTICDQGYDSAQQSFIRSFSDRELDAATLLLPILGFLPADDPRILGTAAAVQKSLGESVFVHRYRERSRKAQDPGLFFSFLYVSVLALMGRTDEASDRLAELCSYATPSGFFGQNVDLRTGYTIGQFPSTEVHLALIQAAAHVAVARGRAIPLAPGDWAEGLPELKAA